MKILAALVTCNRSILLERCIDSLINQSLKPNEIFVVDNGSTDNTEEILIKKKIKYVKQKNLGSSGGWFTAIQYFSNNNFDYIWLMDDDGYPEKKALEKLVYNFKP